MTPGIERTALRALTIVLPEDLRLLLFVVRGQAGDLNVLQALNRLRMTEEEIERAIQNTRNVLAWGNTVADYDTAASISAKQWNRFQGQYLGKVAGAADGLQALRAKIPLDAPAGQTMTVVSSFDYIVRIRNTGVLPDGSTSIVTEAWSFDTPVTKGIQRVKRVTSAINAAPDGTQRPGVADIRFYTGPGSLRGHMEAHSRNDPNGLDLL